MNPSKLIDLTLPFSPKTPVFPGDPAVKVDQVFTVAKDGVSVHNYSFAGHTCTHIDAPSHFVRNGKTLFDLSLEKFTGEGIVIDARGRNQIDLDILRGVKLKKDCIVFFWTDYVKKANEKNYFEDHPVITEKLAHELVHQKVKIVGVDSPSPDKDPYPIHKILLSKETLILENLCNLHLLNRKKFEVFSFPLKVATDGIPVRVVAQITDLK